MRIQAVAIALDYGFCIASILLGDHDGHTSSVSRRDHVSDTHGPGPGPLDTLNSPGQ